MAFKEALRIDGFTHAIGNRTTAAVSIRNSHHSAQKRLLSEVGQQGRTHFQLPPTRKRLDIMVRDTRSSRRTPHKGPPPVLTVPVELQLAAEVAALGIFFSFTLPVWALSCHTRLRWLLTGI